MQNYFAIETEAAFRRSEWERAVAAATRAAQARPKNCRKRWSQPPHLVFARLRSLSARLRSLSAPRLPLASSLTPRRRTAAC